MKKKHLEQSSETLCSQGDGHQTGSGLKRNVEDAEEMKKKYRKGDDDDELLATVGEALERQLAYQQQIGGNPLAREPKRFEFLLHPYVDRRSERMGVRERHYTANLRQQGQFVEHQRLMQALSEAIYTALENLILCERIPGGDYLSVLIWRVTF